MNIPEFLYRAYARKDKVEVSKKRVIKDGTAFYLCMAKGRGSVYIHKPEAHLTPFAALEEYAKEKKKVHIQAEKNVKAQLDSFIRANTLGVMNEQAALASRLVAAPDQPTSPPELSKEKSDLQDDMAELDRARTHLLGALEFLSAYDFSGWAESVLAVIDRLSWEINDLEDRINEP